MTVYFVDDGLDTGDIAGEAVVPIHPKETPESLTAKLNEEGTRVLLTVIQQFAAGTVERRKQPPAECKSRTRPTRAQRNELARRLPHWRRLGDGRQALKTGLWLALFHSGIYSLLRWFRRGQSRGAILLYHRVNDISADVLTPVPGVLPSILLTLRHYYHPIPTDELYLDVREAAPPLLAAAGAARYRVHLFRVCGHHRVFLQDEKKYPQHFQNLRTRDDSLKNSRVALSCSSLRENL